MFICLERLTLSLILPAVLNVLNAYCFTPVSGKLFLDSVPKLLYNRLLLTNQQQFKQKRSP